VHVDDVTVFGKVAGKALKGLWKETKHDGVVARLWVRLWVSPTAAKQAKWYEKQPDSNRVIGSGEGRREGR